MLQTHSTLHPSPAGMRLALGALAGLAAIGCDLVSDPAVPSDPPPLTIQAPSVHLPVGGEMVLVAVLGAAWSDGGASGGTAGGGAATWSSSDPGVLEVSQTGRARGRSPGAATVTARWAGAEAGIALRVSAPDDLIEIVNLDDQGRKLARFDMDGHALDVHGGEILWHEGLYYWYGEYYACGFQWQTAGTPFCGFRVFTSPDLQRWTDRGELFPLNDVWQVLCGGQGSGCFRPHVLRNPTTGRWVLWFNGYDAPGGYYLFEADSPLGPFFHRHDPAPAQGVRPQRGDHNLFADDDGTGYIAYTLWPRGDIVVEELTDDYLDTTGRHVVLGLDFVEAPALFRRGDRYYLTVSDPACGYCETGTSYLTAPDPMGPWSEPRQISTTSCGGQPGHVSSLPASDGSTWYLFYSDLWNYREFNQATATQYIAPLVFDDEGEIMPLSCAPSSWAPALVESQLPSAEGEWSMGSGMGQLATEMGPNARGRAICDIGESGVAGRVQREFRFTPQVAGRLRRVSLNLLQQGSRNSGWEGSPDAPLVAELRAPTGSALASTELRPDEVPWSARVLDLPFDIPVEEGVEYALRLRSEPERGCYGLAYRETPVDLSGIGSYRSRDGGATWTRESGRQPFLRVEIDG